MQAPKHPSSRLRHGTIMAVLTPYRSNWSTFSSILSSNDNAFVSARRCHPSTENTRYRGQKARQIAVGAAPTFSHSCMFSRVFNLVLFQNVIIKIFSRNRLRPIILLTTQGASQDICNHGNAVKMLVNRTDVCHHQFCAPAS